MNDQRERLIVFFGGFGTALCLVGAVLTMVFR